MNLILFGAPGAGKGTQAKKLVEKYHLTHISTGEMFRDAIAKQTEMGKLANSYIKDGNLVPDEVTVGLVKERIQEEDCKLGFILDGFPRTLPQAECLDTICKELNIKIDYVIDIEVGYNQLIDRLSGRRLCSKCGASYHIIHHAPIKENTCDVCGGELYTRNDDRKEAVEVRLINYEKQTLPLKEYYAKKNMLVSFDGDKAMDDVFKDIVNSLGE